MSDKDLPVFQCSMKRGIKRTRSFEEKRLASYAVNVGVHCGHDCTYCSSRVTLRRHEAFPEVGKSPFDRGYAIVDPSIVEKVAHNAVHAQKRGLVMLCTTVDAWSPEASQHNLGRRCLEAILREPGWTVRVLTKNANVVHDFDLIQKYRDRVLVSLSLTGTPDKQEVLSVTEPYASPISERLAALEQAHKLGLRTYGMLCPLLPSVADSQEQIDWLVHFVAACGAEEVFCEGVNARGNGLRVTEEALEEHGFLKEAAAASRVRHKRNRSPYVVSLIQKVQSAMRRHLSIKQLRFLLYRDLTAKDQAFVEKHDAGVVWL